MVIKRTANPPQTPGEIIRSFRQERGITLEDMAEFLYCSKAELSLFENDRKAISKMKRLLWSTLVPYWTPDMLKQVDKPEFVQTLSNDE